MLVWCFWFVVFQFSVAYPNRNNVCRTFPDYANIAFSKNCWFNPDINSSPSLIAKRYGYPLEKYKITTEDGYILTLYRIPHNNTDLNTKRQPVLLQHGIGASAIFWMLRGQKSLAFFLVNNGYDVWLSSARGTIYSARHERLKTQDPLYWNFSFHEMAVYDLPVTIDFISNTTKQKGNIIYIGHSMGSTQSYIYSALKKNHANTHLKALISLSPVAYMQNTRGLYKVLGPIVSSNVNFFYKLGLYAVGYPPAFQKLISVLCGKHPTIILCFMLNVLSVGLVNEQALPETFPVFANYFPAGISVKTLSHFGQLISTGGFQQYDYGPDNIAVYNSSRPPIYDVAEISLPVFLFIGRQDIVAPEKDVNTLYEKLISSRRKNTVSKYYLNFAHQDFIMAKDLKEFYDLLLDVMMNKIGNT